MTSTDLSREVFGQAPERANLAQIREAREYLIWRPAMPVRPEILPDPDGVLCTGCDMPPDSPRVFTDSDGMLWCERCACSDVIGAALTA